MSEKRFKWIDKDTISDNQTDEWYCFLFDDIRDDFVDLLNEEQSKIRELEEENEKLREELAFYKSKKFAGGTTLYYFKEMGQKTAADYLLQSEKPVLIMQGGRDFQVLADEDYQKFKELLAERSNTFYKLYPQLNHVFVDAIYDDIGKAAKEYSTERRIGEEVITDITSFIGAFGSDL